MDRIIEYFFNFQVMAKYWPKLWSGFLVTLEMAILIVIFGLFLGLALAVIRAFQIKPVNWILIFFVDLFRAVPALVLLTIIYFALPYAGITVEPFGATVICLIGVLAVYAEEIFWAGIISIDRGQWEAARSTGLNFIRTLFFVVLPQAIRMCIPPMTNWTIAITKLTALGSVVAAQEILNQSMSAQALAANPSPLTLGAFLYLVIFIPLVVGSRWIERRFGWAK